MKKISLALALFLTLIVVVACSTVKNELGITESPGVTYNKISISQNDVDSDFKAIAENDVLVQLFNETSTEKFVIDGDLSPTYKAAWVNVLVKALAVREVRMKYNVSINEEDKKSARADAEKLFPGVDDEQTAKIWNAFPKSFQNRMVNYFAEQYALLRAAKSPSDKDIKKFFDENQNLIAPACESGKALEHILVSTEADANEVISELNSGADFADIAQEKSQDEGSKDTGGKLGCFTEGQYVPEFESAGKALAIGKISQPVKTTYGYHIIKAVAYTAPTLEEVKDDVREYLLNQNKTKILDEVKQELSKASVKVLNKYGTVISQDGVPTVVSKEEAKNTSTTISTTPTT